MLTNKEKFKDPESSQNCEIVHIEFPTWKIRPGGLVSPFFCGILPLDCGRGVFIARNACSLGGKEA